MPKLVEVGAPEIRYEVTWCESIPVDECGDKDIDNAVMVAEHYRTLGLAVARAKRLLREKRDQFGSVEITEERWEAHPDLPGRFWWSQRANVFVDDLRETIGRLDFRTIDNGY